MVGNGYNERGFGGALGWCYGGSRSPLGGDSPARVVTRTGEVAPVHGSDPGISDTSLLELGSVNGEAGELDSLLQVE